MSTTLAQLNEIQHRLQENSNYSLKQSIIGQSKLQAQGDTRLLTEECNHDKSFGPFDLTTSHNHNRLKMANEIENAKLEETIKSLEQNLASLPQSFGGRVSRMRENSSLREKFAANRRGPSLRPQLLPQNQLIKSQTIENQETPKQNQNQTQSSAFKFAIQGFTESSQEERNLPLTAFLPKSTNFKQNQQQFSSKGNHPSFKEIVNEQLNLCTAAPVGDDDFINIEDDLLQADDNLLLSSEKGKLLTDEWENQDTDLLSGLNEGECLEDVPFTIAAKSPTKSNWSRGAAPIQGFGQSSFYEELKTEPQPSRKQEYAQHEMRHSNLTDIRPSGRVSLTTIYKQKNRLHPAKSKMNDESTSKKTQDGNLNSDRQPTNNGPHTQSFIQQNPQIKVGLNPCQRQGPALAAKKAFDHKKKRFARDLEDQEADSRFECEHCCRRFKEESLQKHILICEKVFIKKRKAFNAQRQRAFDEDHLKLLEIAQQKFSYYNENQKLNTKWRIRSAHFRAAIENARSGNPSVQNSNLPDDRIQCQYCLKKFAPVTAERHIPICQKKTLDIKNIKQGQKTVMAKSVTSSFKGPMKK